MKHDRTKLLKVIDFLNKKLIKVPNSSNIEISLSADDYDYLKLTRNDVVKIFNLMADDDVLEIKQNFLNDFNKINKKAYKECAKKIPNKNKNGVLSDYEAALLFIRADKKIKETKNKGDLIIKIKNKDAFNNYKENKRKEADETVVYEISYRKNREIVLNGKKVIAKPDFDSENDNFFNYVFERPNIKIDTKELSKILTLKKRIPSILADLGFAGDLKKMFFPASSKNAILFINPITKKYLKDNGLKGLK